MRSYTANKEAQNALRVANNRLRKYGITKEQWDELFRAQGECCAGCRSPEPGRKDWATDHCHTTGRVRGILCDGCNLALGHVKDDPDRLEALARYLRTKDR